MNLDLNSATYYLYDAIHSSILQFVPEVSYKQSNFPAWFSKDLKSLVYSKNKAHALFKSTQDQQNYYYSFSLIRARFKRESKKCYNNFLRHSESQLISNPRSFWKFVLKNRSNSSIPNSLHLDDIRSSGKKQIVNLFLTYFSSVYKPASSTPIPDGPFQNFFLPSNVSFSILDIEKELDKLSTSTNACPDGLPGTFLAKIKHAIIIPLWIIFRRSLDKGVFPDIWKMTSITPIH